eukprot:1474813-Heterocapsa_arctica.AAC.1
MAAGNRRLAGQTKGLMARALRASGLPWPCPVGHRRGLEHSARPALGAGPGPSYYGVLAGKREQE